MIDRAFAALLWAAALTGAVVTGLIVLVPQIPGSASVGIGIVFGYVMWRIELWIASPDFEYSVVQGRLAIGSKIAEAMADLYVVHNINIGPRKLRYHLVTLDLVELGGNRPLTIRLWSDPGETACIKGFCKPGGRIHVFAYPEAAKSVGVGDPSTKRGVVTRRA